MNLLAHKNNLLHKEGRMKSKCFGMIATILLLGFLPDIAFAKITLTYNNYLPPVHIGSKLSESWCKEIEKRTNGEVEFKYFPGGQLLPPTKTFEGVVQGIADIGFTNLAYTRGRFPEMEMCDLPLGMPSGWVSTYVVNKFYQKYRPKEFDAAKILFFAGSGPNLISTTEKPVSALADLKGQTLRATGRIADTAAALGATSRPIAIGETYESVKRNVISGVMLPLETMKAFRLGELLKYCTADWQVGNIYTFFAVMNKNKWNKLPENIKKIFEEVNAEWIEKSAVGWNDVDRIGADFFKNKGGKFIQLSDQEAEKWNQAIAPVIDTYMQEMTQKGLSMDELKARVEFIRKTRDEMIKEQTAKGIPMPYAE
jgi:TRAP-type C4-dicarboxylate transport system substrate-binding protein